MNNFELDLDKTITKLAGNQLGRYIFQEQLKEEIDYKKEITITFPDRIDTIASSFIQGFFEEIVQNIGISGVESMVIINSSIPNIKKLILENLL
ncbi:hypothetical protein NSQ62_08505 [Solibacillus sp. FSL H8-0523]|uniref:hypothetical protein n=1 Tax=Solibacillus sp. FSL H8-0523 TaxID=2954511 RepID=UPI003101829F